MARIVDPSKKQEAGWRRWVKSRPAAVRAIAERFDPWSLYRIKPNGERVYLVSINENGTLTVGISGRFNAVVMERNVFGIDPDDLEPCDLPGPDEMTGSLLTDSQVDDNIDALRVMVRPDLWVMDEDGKATRRQ